MPKAELSKHIERCSYRVDVQKGVMKLAEDISTKKYETVPRTNSDQNFSWQLGEDDWGAGKCLIILQFTEIIFVSKGEPQEQKPITLGRNPYS